MSEKTIDNATVSIRANVYYDGNVTSRDVIAADGERKTLGIMQSGDYTFETEDEETIEVYAGALVATIPGQCKSRYTSGDMFSVPPKTSFDVSVEALVEYCCTYR